VFHKDSSSVYRAEALERLGWLEHGFGTRHSSLPANLTTLRQVHSDIAIRAGGRSGIIGEGDALIAETPGTLVAVKTADCLPILIADVRRRRVAAIHSGWRGAVRQIAPKTLRAMGSDPADVLVAMGPAIGPCCYEVGPEVAIEFRELFPERTDLDRRTKIDLGEANRRQLIAAGVPAGRIYTAALCTRCCGGEFYSWRRERERAGRMYSWIGIRASEPAEPAQDQQ
jgi:YfiH family protein